MDEPRRVVRGSQHAPHFTANLGGNGYSRQKGSPLRKSKTTNSQTKTDTPSWFEQHCESPSNNGLRIQYQKVRNTKCRRGRGETETFIHRGWECKMVRPVWKTVWLVLKRFNMDLPYDPAIPLLGVDPREPKMNICSKTWTRVFRMATTQTSIR